MSDFLDTVFCISLPKCEPKKGTPLARSTPCRPGKTTAPKETKAELGAAAAEDKTKKTPLPVKATVREIMADGELHPGDFIVEQVRQKLGEAAKRFTIFGILDKGKEFEKVDDQFRLKK